ncbi:HAMP domain-containing sensor histidine kinase [Spongiactinospora sp. TRM90649]|uniref:sensor histidine kinase n=1 Tax=Spongiactinospora sp. TRM90649 TaxID=3031114 RepID=UPI0023F9DE9D|nr:HAMP domain-containing sensor histidine kinase [Spongiactinospora sp. TRM90649]MDF5752719.1 HAMP domain-containing sensor histidine kinase [Spongiactinospora sp. TRM90649]
MGGLLRGWTARSRFTVLYAALFLGSAVVLLVLTNVLTSVTVSETAPGQVPPVAVDAGLAAAQRQIHALQAELSETRSTQARELVAGSLIALAVMAGLSVLLGNAVAGRVLRPVRTITAATRRISAENLHERLTVRGPADEVKNLADTIDDLLERLEGAFAAQRGFVANASHELRTPLATMRASVDVALAKPEPAPPATVALAGRLRVELDRVDRLLDGLLVLARAQHGPRHAGLGELVPVSLADLLSRTVAAHADAIAARNLTLHDDGPQGAAAWTLGSPTLLSRMADNVIGNAVVHNRDGGWIRVAARTDGTTARFVVESGGPPLDPEHVARLGRPFQRLTPDRTGSGTGSGLGLSIVAAIAESHGGRLDLLARPEGGLRVTVSLPVAAPPEGA